MIDSTRILPDEVRRTVNSFANTLAACSDIIAQHKEKQDMSEMFTRRAGNK